ncbi:MAG: trypsin-like peptidase domain-containing protein [Blastocatellia bacterium]
MEEVNRNAAFGRPTTPLNVPAARRPRGKRWTIVGLTLLVAGLVVIVGLLQARAHRGAGKPPELPPSLAAISNNAPSPTELSRSFREVIKSVKDAVVFIDVVETVNQGDAPEGFFGLPLPKGPQQREGAGSGFIATEDGYILTNNHVIRNANTIKVTLADRREFKAEVIGKDAATDIAVIHINASGLPVARLGNSDDVQQGDWVLALGNPFGLQQTITAGIISATGRELGASQYNKYIQTDAPINPGNSGGPLVNMQGEVIGINTLIYTGGQSVFGQGGNIGIGFAIASNAVRDVFSKLVTSGKVSRGYLGVLVGPLTEAAAHAAGLEPESAVFVSAVPDPNSPAGKAGIRAGDIITAFNGEKVRAPRELTDKVAATPVGAKARVDYIRDGQPQTATVELTERPEETTARQVQPDNDGDEDNPGGPQQGRLGVLAQTVTPELATQLKLQNQSGALVIQVAPNSPAARAGIQHGDVIHKVDRTEIKSSEELAKAISALQAGKYQVMIERKSQIAYVDITLE